MQHKFYWKRLEDIFTVHSKKEMETNFHEGEIDIYIDANVTDAL